MQKNFLICILVGFDVVPEVHKKEKQPKPMDSCCKSFACYTLKYVK